MRERTITVDVKDLVDATPTSLPAFKYIPQKDSRAIIESTTLTMLKIFAEEKIEKHLHKSRVSPDCDNNNNPVFFEIGYACIFD